MSNLTTLPNEEARPEMDEMLHDYFQAEMPHPWPTFKAPKSMRATQPASSWSRYAGRLALGASIACLIGGYLMLGAFFPRTQALSGLENVAPDMSKGLKEKHKS